MNELTTEQIEKSVEDTLDRRAKLVAYMLKRKQRQLAILLDQKLAVEKTRVKAKKKRKAARSARKINRGK